MPEASNFEAPMQPGGINNPGWTDDENRQRDTWVNSGIKTAGQATADIEKARSESADTKAAEPLADTADTPESMGDRIGSFEPTTSAEHDIADADVSVTEARADEERLRIVRDEPESPEDREIRSASLRVLKNRYGQDDKPAA